MARQRFSDLERVYDALKLGNVAYTSLPQGLDFVKYAKWREGDSPMPAGRNVRPNLQGEAEVGVIAFGLSETNEAAKQLVTISGRSKAFLAGFGAGGTFNVRQDLTTAGHGYIKNGNFIPAKARIAVVAAGVAQTSRITGRRYKSKTNAAYTVPMGQATAGTRYQAAINAILINTVFAGTPTTQPTHVVSFDPEEFRRD